MPMADEHLYYLNYRLDARPDGFGREEAKALTEEGLGSCDGMFLAPIIWPEDEGGNTHSSTQLMSMDGRTGEELSAHELFSVWSMMSKMLSEHPDLDPGRKEFTSHVFEAIRAAVLGKG